MEIVADIFGVIITAWGLACLIFGIFATTAAILAARGGEREVFFTMMPGAVLGLALGAFAIYGGVSLWA